MKSSVVTVWPAWLSWIRTRCAIALTMPRPRPCVASWSACSAFGAVPVPPSSVTDRATPCEETARESTAVGELRDPGRVWMVGDNPVAEIAGAHAVGVPGILIDPSEDGLKPAVQRILGRPPMSWP